MEYRRMMDYKWRENKNVSTLFSMEYCCRQIPQQINTVPSRN